MSTTTPVSGVPVSLWLPWRPRLIPGRASCLVRGCLAPPGSSHGVSWTISCTDQERRYLSQIPSLAYSEAMAYERITIDPNRMSGLPCIRDTRVKVSAVLGQLAAGRSFDEVLADYPYLERADILAVLEFAAAVQEREPPLARPA